MSFIRVCTERRIEATLLNAHQGPNARGRIVVSDLSDCRKPVASMPATLNTTSTSLASCAIVATSSEEEEEEKEEGIASSSEEEEEVEEEEEEEEEGMTSSE